MSADNTCSCVNEETDYHAESDNDAPRFDLLLAHAVEHWHTADVALQKIRRKRIRR